jgi:hypothetical protein
MGNAGIGIRAAASDTRGGAVLFLLYYWLYLKSWKPIRYSLIELAGSK